MQQYKDLGNEILNNGVFKNDRTGIGTYSIFGHQMRFDISESFPLLTLKKVHLKSIIHELLWFLNGSTNNNELLKNDVSIWSEWATLDGELGPIYGKQWTAWPVFNKPNEDDLLCACTDLVNNGATNKLDEYSYTINQVQDVIDTINSDPDSRRLIISGWNPQYLPDTNLSPQDNVLLGKQCLPPCHTLYQFYLCNNKLSCHLYMRK